MACNRPNGIGSKNYRAQSSRELKENIVEFSSNEAFEALGYLNPVTFQYKGDKNGELHLGFVAEDVSSIVATSDRKGIDPIAIIAILSRVAK